MAHDLLEFMEEALEDEKLLEELTTKYNELYDEDGDPKVQDPDQELSNWFDEKGYNISKGQCKKLKEPMDKAKGKIMPKY